MSSTPPTTQVKWIAILQSPIVAKISNLQDDALKLTPTAGETTLKPGIAEDDALILTPTTGETTLKPGIVDDDASTAGETTEALNNDRSVESSTLYEELRLT